MSLRIDTAEWIPGALLIGEAGLGVLAEHIPSDGDDGGSYLYNDISLPADAGKEICGRITTWPSAGTLFAYENGAFEFSGAPDGDYAFTYQLYVDGVASGAGTVSLKVGAPAASAAIAATAANAIFAGSAGSYAPQLLAPVADISAGAWTPFSGSDLYSMLDESSPDDADYIVSTTASSCEMRLSVGATPSASGDRILRYRLLAGTGNLAVALRQGSTPIAAWGPHALTASAQDFAQTLTAGQAAAITDYSDLRVVFTAS